MNNHNTPNSQEETREVCLHCGSEMKDGQQFCVKCGTQRGEPKTAICQACGEKLTVEENFCPKCGQRMKWSASTRLDSQYQRIRKKGISKKLILMGISALLVIALILGAVALLTSVDRLCAKGDYQAAYEMAIGGRKTEVMIESLAASRYANFAAAFLTNDAISLEEIYYCRVSGDGEETVDIMVLLIKYKDLSLSYLTYARDEKDGWKSCGEVDVEEHASAKIDQDDIFTCIKVGYIWTKNVIVNLAVENGYQMKEDTIERINRLHQNGEIYLINSIEEIEE